MGTEGERNPWKNAAGMIAEVLGADHPMAKAATVGEEKQCVQLFSQLSRDERVQLMQRAQAEHDELAKKKASLEADNAALRRVIEILER